MTAQTGAGAGLVLCATTSRHPVPPSTGSDSSSAEDGLEDLVARFWKPQFPSPELVRAAAALLPAVKALDVGPSAQLVEGPHWRISIGPGVVAVGTRDYARDQRREERELRAQKIDVDMAVAYFEAEGEWPAEPESQREITEWSRKSRARMTRTLCELDYAPLYESGRMPAMVTLTYPGDWLTVAPTGKDAKKHVKQFRARYERAWGEPLNGIWKQEFQRRGAPHFHILTTPPHGHARTAEHRDGTPVVGSGLPFHQWLSEVWADIVDHPDPEERRRHVLAGTGVDYAEGLRAKDPRRVAVYFLKHNVAGDKEYQHWVPEAWQEPGAGPGRFWGYWGLSKAVAVVEVAPDDAVAAARVMRRWSRAQGRVRKVRRPRTPGGVPHPRYAEVEGLAGAELVRARGRTRYRTTTVRAVMLPHSRGWIALNDGPSFAADLARYLDSRRQQACRQYCSDVMAAFYREADDDLGREQDMRFRSENASTTAAPAPARA